MMLGFMAHGYIWAGDRPSDRLPPPISIPLLAISAHLEVPPVATYAGLCLWNFKPLFVDEPIDNLENLSTLTTFTGSIDESWFYLVSVAIEARGGPIIPLMLHAIAAARANDSTTVTRCLQSFAERLDALATLLQRMNDGCDPHVFYNRIRPFLAGSKNMEAAGLPNGVIYKDGTGIDRYRQYSGGSNAQSPIIQFFDAVLGVVHRPTGEKRDFVSESESEGRVPKPKHNFIEQMRSYMCGPHKRFLDHVNSVANIREYVEDHTENRELVLAFDACLAMLSAFRDKHINIVTRYIILKSREARRTSTASQEPPQKLNIATGSREQQKREENGNTVKKLKGTGGTALIPFLKQARDETGEPAVENWARKIMKKESVRTGRGDFFLGKVEEQPSGEVFMGGMAGKWTIDEEGGGGLCTY